MFRKSNTADPKLLIMELEGKLGPLQETAFAVLAKLSEEWYLGIAEIGKNQGGLLINFDELLRLREKPSYARNFEGQNISIVPNSLSLGCLIGPCMPTKIDFDLDNWVTLVTDEGAFLIAIDEQCNRKILALLSEYETVDHKAQKN